MPSHFSTIGIPITHDEEFWEIAQNVASQSEKREVKQGAYYYWHDASGAELWLQVNHENELIGMNPHFGGQSQVRVGLTHRVNRPNESGLDGALHGWADPEPDDPEGGLYPFVFDLPNLAEHGRLNYPSLALVQIAAFTHELRLYDSVSAYDEEVTEGAKFASQSFIPAGLFSPEAERMEPPQSYAILTGHILKFDELENGLSRMKYLWCLVETLGGTFDVVIDPQLISERPQVGGVLSGTFWLSGTLLEWE